MKLMREMFPNFVECSMQRDDMDHHHPVRLRDLKRAYYENVSFKAYVSPALGYMTLHYGDYFSIYSYVSDASIDRVMVFLDSIKPASIIEPVDLLTKARLFSQAPEGYAVNDQPSYACYFQGANKLVEIARISVSKTYCWNFVFDRRLVTIGEIQDKIYWDAAVDQFMPHQVYFDDAESLDATMQTYIAFCSQFSSEFRWDIVVAGDFGLDEPYHVEITYPPIFLHVGERVEIADLSYLNYRG